jgi:GT2 family glycosyltransferase
MARVSVIVVTYQSRDSVGQCLRSVADQADEVVVVDNASTDGTCELITRQFTAAKLIANRRNRGFAAAVNQGLIAASGDYLLVLNPDTEVAPGALRQLGAFLGDHPEVGLVGPQLRDQQDAVIPSCTTKPTLGILLVRATAFRWLVGRSASQRRYEMADCDWSEPGSVEVISGACMMARREAIAQVGGLDESFFLYFEDDDWCMRMGQCGWQVWYWPGAVVTHLGGASTGQISRRRRRNTHLRSAARCLRKHSGLWAALAFRAVVLANSLFLAPARLLQVRRR